MNGPLRLSLLVVVFWVLFASCNKLLHRRTAFERMNCEQRIQYAADTLTPILGSRFSDSMHITWHESGQPWLDLKIITPYGRAHMPHHWQEVFDERCLAGMHFDTFDSLFVRGVDSGYYRGQLVKNYGHYTIYTTVAPANNPVKFSNWRVVRDINWRPKPRN